MVQDKQQKVENIHCGSQPDSMLKWKTECWNIQKQFCQFWSQAIFLQEEHELNEKFHSIRRKIYFRKYVSFYSVQRNFAYWLETQPINHNKELDAYTISVLVAVAISDNSIFKQRKVVVKVASSAFLRIGTGTVTRFNNSICFVVTKNIFKKPANF